MEELVKRLRIFAQLADKGLLIPPSLCFEAADAIEELVKESERWQAEAKDWYLAYMDLLPTREESEEENG